MLEINAHYFVGRDPMAALGANRIEALAHRCQVDFLARDHGINVTRALGEDKANSPTCATEIVAPTPLTDRVIFRI